MRIAIGCDHVGFAAKEPVVEALQQEGHAVLDLGTYATAPVDYPPLVRAVVNAVLNRFVDVGILLCERGTGAAIGANKFKGVRALYCADAATARASREHEDSNVLCLGATDVDAATALEIARQWLGSQFSNDATDVRHVAQLAEMDQGLGATPAAAPAARPPAAAKAKEPARETPREAPRQVARPKPAPASAPAAAPARAASGLEWPPQATAAVEEPQQRKKTASNVAQVEAFIASLPDENVKSLTARALAFFTSRFPGIEGAPSPLGDGFTLTLNGEHATSVYIGRGLVWFEAGPDRIPSNKIKDIAALESAMNLPSVVRALQGLVPS